MGLSKAMIAIKGDCTKNLAQVADILDGLCDAGDFNDDSFNDDSLLKTWAQTINVDNGWTILPDEEMVVVSEDDLLLTLATTLNTEVLALYVQSTSATYGFTYINPKQESDGRVFMAQDGEVFEDEGDKLPIENTLNINEAVLAIDIILIDAEAADDITTLADSFKGLLENILAIEAAYIK